MSNVTGTGASLGSQSAATLTIIDDDADVSVAVLPSSVAEDGGTNLTYTFTRNGATSGALTANFSVGGTATFGTDCTQSGAASFASSSGTVTFGAGNSPATVTVDPTSDTGPEADETVILTVTSGTGYNVAAPSSATGTITNDDQCPTSFLVNDAGDADDVAPGDGLCATGGGVCTLRAAIEEANALSLCGTLDINFSGVTSPINLSSALPAINHDVNINGPGASLLTVQRSTLGGTPNFRIFNATVASPSMVTFSGLTIANGSVNGDNGGGIRNSGTGTVNVISCVLGNNSASLGVGGAIVNNNSGTVNIINSTLSNNSSPNNGGGGGVHNVTTGTINVANSTLSNNSATRGGGINNASIGTITVANSTFTSNSATFGGGIFNGGTGPIQIRNSIVALNTAINSGADLDGTFNSQDYNLIGNTSGATFTGTTTRNIINVNALLGPLANNGGPTQTHALLPGSPAINAGSNGNLPADTFDLDGDADTAEPLPVDQRGPGFSRISNTTVDIGAFESRGFTISATSGTPQSAPIMTTFSALVATVSSASGEPVGGGQVTFTAPASGASGTFAGGGTTVTVTTNSSGVATTPTFTANNLAGSYNVSAGLRGGSPSTTFALTNSKGQAQVTLSNVVHTYDGNPKSATVTTVPSPLNVTLTYDGSSTPPTNAGNYAIVAAVNDANYDGQATGTLTINKANQTITFGALANRTFGDPDFTVSPTASSNLPVSLAASGACSVTGGTVHLTGGGFCTITASQSGNLNFNPAADVPQTFNVAGVISINDVSATEGDSGTKTFTFTVSLSAASNQTITVNYATADSTATAGSDYVSTGNTLTFNPGDLTKTVGVTVNGDQSFEPNDTFFVSLSNAVNATVSDNQGLGMILNDDAQGGIISFSQSNYSVGESDGQLTITVNRGGDISAPATVDYATSDSGAEYWNQYHLASSKCDFTTALGTLRFAGGEASKTFTVLINQDVYVEGFETFNLTLSNISGGAVFGAVSTATATINDDVSEPPTNAIDDATNFVRQHYHDFLNREPDQSGLDFWVSNFTQCGGDPQCLEVKRINVSAAFFLSIEFQQTGYLVERIYKTAYGDATGNSTFPSAHTLPVPMVRFNEFLSDTQQIGLGVVVGRPGWEETLENNKQAFAAEFVQRSRFTSAFGSMSNSQFVNQLNTNAGNPLLQSELDQLLTDLNNSQKTRAQVLRAVAEHPNLVNAEFNRAFVLMQFFGYLRRNPNDPQDIDHTGHDFWLTKLNQFGGNFQNAEMVKAFISSIEYRQRFGP